ncbi:MAG: DNA polymerase Y family protein [Sphingobacteriales bacterium]|nr:MAG: DNA polymerase Y family protein [Sphingobacteriales bacterium]
MAKRFVAIWFCHLMADWIVRRNPNLAKVPFVLAMPERGRMVIKAVNKAAHSKGIHSGMVVADCRAILPGLQVFDYNPEQKEKLLNALAEWCMRYTPIAAVDEADGLILDVSGCTHLWGGEEQYLKDITTRFSGLGYHIRIAIADTVGTAWAVSRYGSMQIVDQGKQLDALLPLHPIALRLNASIVDRLIKLGLYTIGSFIKMPRSALRRRFGEALLTRLDQALGQAIEVVTPVKPVEPYQERLPCLEPVRTATAIEIAIQKLLDKLCKQLEKDGKGLRLCTLKAYRVDNNIQQIRISTTRASRNATHLFKLFEIKVATIEPALGFELFMMEAPVVEDMTASQDAFWNTTNKHNEANVAELLDKLAGKVGIDAIHRYLPDEHYWPERSFKLAASLDEKPDTDWRTDMPRPVHLLPEPELIEVTVPIPDYPPMLFIHKGKLHKVSKADGPERIEQEWWLQQGLYRDYYCIEDENGARYWIFRLGRYDSGEPKWFIHGFFA